MSHSRFYPLQGQEARNIPETSSFSASDAERGDVCSPLGEVATPGARSWQRSSSMPRLSVSNGGEPPGQQTSPKGEGCKSPSRKAKWLSKALLITQRLKDVVWTPATSGASSASSGSQPSSEPARSSSSSQGPAQQARSANGPPEASPSPGQPPSPTSWPSGQPPSPTGWPSAGPARLAASPTGWPSSSELPSPKSPLSGRRPDVPSPEGSQSSAGPSSGGLRDAPGGGGGGAGGAWPSSGSNVCVNWIGSTRASDFFAESEDLDLGGPSSPDSSSGGGGERDTLASAWAQADPEEDAYSATSADGPSAGLFQDASVAADDFSSSALAYMVPVWHSATHCEHESSEEDDAEAVARGITALSALPCGTPTLPADVVAAAAAFTLSAAEGGKAAPSPSDPTGPCVPSLWVPVPPVPRLVFPCPPGAAGDSPPERPPCTPPLGNPHPAAPPFRTPSDSGSSGLLYSASGVSNSSLALATFEANVGSGEMVSLDHFLIERPSVSSVLGAPFSQRRMTPVLEDGAAAALAAKPRAIRSAGSSGSLCAPAARSSGSDGQVTSPMSSPRRALAAALVLGPVAVRSPPSPRPMGQGAALLFRGGAGMRSPRGGRDAAPRGGSGLAPPARAAAGGLPAGVPRLQQQHGPVILNSSYDDGGGYFESLAPAVRVAPVVRPSPRRAIAVAVAAAGGSDPCEWL